MADTKHSEERLFQLVKNGHLTIDGNGHVYKNGKNCEHKMPQGYMQTRVMIDGIRYHTGSHRLVWRWHNGNIPDGLVINHIDGNKANNHICNLEVCTPSENSRHAYRIGLRDEHGERNPASKLSDTDVDEIRRLYASGNFRQYVLAEMFAVSFQQISRIVRGERRVRQPGEVSRSDHRRNYAHRDGKTGRFILNERLLCVQIPNNVEAQE